MKSENTIRQFFKKNIRKILIAEIVIFIIIVASAYVKSYYTTQNPFFDFQHTTWQNSQLDIIISGFIVSCFSISFFAIFIFPIIYVIEVISVFVLKINDRTNSVLCIALVFFYILNLGCVFVLSTSTYPSSTYRKIQNPYIAPSLYSDTFNTKEFEANQQSDTWTYYLQDSTKVEVSFMINSKNDTLYLKKNCPSDLFYEWHERYYTNGTIQERGIYLYGMKTGGWEYFDQNGELEKTVNEDEEFPYKYTYKNLLCLLSKNEYIDGWEAKGKENLCIEYKYEDGVNKSNPYWHVRINDPDPQKIKVLLFDARSGKQISL